MTQFESAYKTKVNLIMINVDERATPEYKKYGEFVKKSGAIPFTLWVDSKGAVLGEQVGGMDARQLASKTDEFVKKAR